MDNLLSAVVLMIFCNLLAMKIDPRTLRIEDFVYELPQAKIAVYPAPNRDESRLLIYRGGVISEDIYRNITRHLPKDALLIFNDTKVVQARLIFQKPTGGNIEIFALEPHERYNDITTAMLERGTVWWKCLVGGAAKWKNDQVLLHRVYLNGSDLTISAKIVERRAGSFIIEFDWQPDTLTFSEILKIAGSMPIPPYLKRETVQPDIDRYQTIYAAHEGSVAAPTAGLHFTHEVLDSFRTRNISYEYVTLHVGAGTFMPVKSETMVGHEMHEEYIDVSISMIEKLLNHSNGVFCVGTTSLRTMESLYWMGVKCLLKPAITLADLVVRQWEVYDQLADTNVSALEAISALLTWVRKNGMERLIIKTQILIAPGYKPKMIRGLITNFHQPGSTLLLLVAALIGEDWKRIYNYALNNDFRFLSYGDGSLLFLN